MIVYDISSLNNSSYKLIIQFYVKLCDQGDLFIDIA